VNRCVSLMGVVRTGRTARQTNFGRSDKGAASPVSQLRVFFF
jgi:hypothetical protein